MGKHNGFQWKRKLDTSAALVTKKKLTAPMLGLEDVYFTWNTVSSVARYTKIVDKLKEYVAVHFCDQARVTARAMEELKDPVCTKAERPVRMYWPGTSLEEGVADNKPKLNDWEHKLAVAKYLEWYKTHKEGTKALAENTGKCYYLVLQNCLPELKPKLKNSARCEGAASDTDAVSLLLITRDVIHNKKERAQCTMGLMESAVSYNNNERGRHFGYILQSI